MTRFLARLADIAYRRRGRMVLAWIAATVVIIGVGSSLAGEYNADYNTPGSESKAASDLTEQRFGGYSGQEIYVVWKDPAGARSPGAAAGASTPSSPRPSRSITSRRTPRSASREDGTIAIDHAAADRPRLGGHQGGRREADRRRRGQQRRRARDQARRGPDLRRAGRSPARRGSASSARRSCC